MSRRFLLVVWRMGPGFSYGRAGSRRSCKPEARKRQPPDKTGAAAAGHKTGGATAGQKPEAAASGQKSPAACAWRPGHGLSIVRLAGEMPDEQKGRADQEGRGQGRAEADQHHSAFLASFFPVQFGDDFPCGAGLFRCQRFQVKLRQVVVDLFDGGLRVPQAHGSPSRWIWLTFFIFIISETAPDCDREGWVYLPDPHRKNGTRRTGPESTVFRGFVL